MDAYFIYRKHKLIERYYNLGCLSWIFRKKKRKGFLIYSRSVADNDVDCNVLYQYDTRKNFGCYTLCYKRGFYKIVIMTQNPEQYNLNTMQIFMKNRVNSLKSRMSQDNKKLS